MRYYYDDLTTAALCVISHMQVNGTETKEISMMWQYARERYPKNSLDYNLAIAERALYLFETYPERFT